MRLLAALLERALPNRACRDAALIVAVLLVSFGVIEQTEACTAFFAFVHEHPDLELDAAILAGMLASLGVAAFAARRWRSCAKRRAAAASRRSRPARWRFTMR